MNKTIEEKLKEEILSSIDEVKNMKGDDRSKEIDNIVKLDNILMNHNEMNRKISETEYGSLKNKNDSLSGFIEIGSKVMIGVGEMIIPLWFYDRMSTKFMIFEKEGNIPTSFIFRNFLGKLKPFK